MARPGDTGAALLADLDIGFEIRCRGRDDAGTLVEMQI
jgi:hypothetical protein